MLKYTTPPSEGHTEWAGTQIGISNVITQQKELDATPTRIDENFLTLHEKAIRVLAGKYSFIHDAIFQGIRVRLFTNSHHLADFWRETMWSVAEWHEKTGRRPSEEVAATISAIVNRSDLPREAVLAPDRHHLLLTNLSFFGELRVRLQEFLAPLLAEKGITLLSGSAVVRLDRAHLFLGGPDSGKSAAALNMLRREGSWLADQMIALRFGRSLKDGRMVIFANPDELDAPPQKVQVFTRAGEPRNVSRDALHLDEPIVAFAAPLERRAYLPTHLGKTNPELVPFFFRSRLENIPDTSEELRATMAGEIESFQRHTGDQVKHFLGYLPALEAANAVARFLASDSSRVILDPITRFGKSNAAMSEPAAVPIGTVTQMNQQLTLLTGILNRLRKATTIHDAVATA